MHVHVIQKQMLHCNEFEHVVFLFCIRVSVFRKPCKILPNVHSLRMELNLIDEKKSFYPY